MRPTHLAAVPLAGLVLVALPISALEGQGVQRPAGFTVVVDPGARDTVAHTPMPPGWHMTTGPGALLFDPQFTASGRYTVDADIFLFPGTSQSGYGIFVGGQGLDGRSPRYLAFLVRRDGHAALEYTSDGRTTALISWAATTAVKPHDGKGEPVLNALSLSIGRDSITISANGQRIGSAPATGLELSGTFGFRVGPDVNLHASKLDLLRHLAPVPPAKRKD
ncbi:MAG TPA: hypothetical protein VFV33_09865 [Gemmatimonadaceae bacterium]|nr:hypothetical protein [Gemmatimonadaceae bacterium]